MTIDIGVKNNAGVQAAYVSAGAIGVKNPTAISVGGFVASLWSVFYPKPVSESGTQSLDFSIVPTSPEEPHPFAIEGDGFSNSLWMVFTSTAAQTLTMTLTTTFDAGIEVWTGIVGEAPDDLSLVGYGQGTLEVAIGNGQRVLMRAHPLLDTETGSGSLTWSVAARPDTGILGFTVDPEILETPGWLGAAVLSATPDTDLHFTLDGGSTVVFTGHTGADGSMAESAVHLPLLTPGAHTITVVDTASSQTETESFSVRLEPQPPDTIPGDTPPTTGISTDPVVHWVLEDPMTGGIGAYEFPINPNQMTSPFPEKQLRVEHPIYPGSQDIIWEGRPDPVQWTVQGTVRTQAFYETLQTYQELQRRIYVIDHMQRGWICSFESLEYTKFGSPADLWAYTYSAKFLIVGGPVSLS